MSAIETNQPPCIRCMKPIFNAFRRDPWCDDCNTELQLMSYTGEEVLQLVLAMLPPMPQHLRPGAVPVVPVATVNQIAHKVLVEKGLLNNIEPDNDEGSGPSKKPLIGV